MKTITYHKLVRDKIPGIIEKDGKHCICSILTDEDYLLMLDQKLDEELKEYQESKSIEELADLLEVMHAVSLARGSSIGEVEQIRNQKNKERGGFEKRILLESVIEE